MKEKGTNFLIQSAVIAALYAALTLALAPFSYGVMQVRISEALTVLPFFTPAAVPGLFVGCLLANIIGPYGLADVIGGSLTTLIAAFLSYKLRGRPLLVPLPPVAANGLIMGCMLHYVFGVPVALWACILGVALGELIACYGIGYPLLKYLTRYPNIFR
ncbi:QueT transporter family protein [Bacilliculturomica massiliensis]|uniref:QueT transporter family protein n=1 Tax=Bacilliculturomica massiliensis TaxID=1917867 RepID=UPI00102F7902|nr:QueT transporter family protein [Bacilliculturomica massiliensis]